MALLLLEALGALLILLLIVWWTMFSGRPKGELPPDASTDASSPDASPDARAEASPRKGAGHPK